MLRITAGQRHLCDGVSRRDVLRVGGASLLGLTLAGLLRAKSVILLFLKGGPAPQDLWDMRLDAPEEIRGKFKPIVTTVPGLSLCERLIATTVLNTL